MGMNEVGVYGMTCKLGVTAAGVLAAMPGEVAALAGGGAGAGFAPEDVDVIAIGAAVFGGCVVVTVVVGAGGILNRASQCRLGDVAVIVAWSSADLKVSPMSLLS
mmetsp:Transcript_77573/g.217716  ORF Transcript_77573/g.217716 Transcript_77573/m.217716 type:complete len:105 (-) Transcript_77573:517-831(-)